MVLQSAQPRWLLVAILIAWRAVACVPAAAQDVEASDLFISGAWARAADPDNRSSQAFVTIRNRGGEVERLLSASSPSAAAVEIRVPDAGAPNDARASTEGLLIPAGGTVTLEPNGPHFFLRDLQQTLEVGHSIRIVLRFDRAGAVTLQVRVHDH